MSVFGPLDAEPRSVRPPFDPVGLESREVRAAAIREALAGVELGVYDKRIVEWLADSDVGTVGTVVSWLHRVRQAGEGGGAP